MMPSAVPKASVPPPIVAIVLLLTVPVPTTLPLTVPWPTSRAPLPTVRLYGPLTAVLVVESPSVSRINEFTVVLAVSATAPGSVRMTLVAAVAPVRVVANAALAVMPPAP